MGALVLAKSMRSRRTSTSSANLGSPRSLRNSLDNPLDLSANASWGTPLADADRGSLAFPENQGTAMQSVAVAGEIDVGANLSLGGWVQVSSLLLPFAVWFISEDENCLATSLPI